MASRPDTPKLIKDNIINDKHTTTQETNTSSSAHEASRLPLTGSRPLNNKKPNESAKNGTSSLSTKNGISKPPAKNTPKGKTSKLANAFAQLSESDEDVPDIQEEDLFGDM